MEHSSVEGMMSMYFQKVAGPEVSMKPYLADVEICFSCVEIDHERIENCEHTGNTSYVSV